MTGNARWAPGPARVPLLADRRGGAEPRSVQPRWKYADFATGQLNGTRASRWTGRTLREKACGLRCGPMTRRTSYWRLTSPRPDSDICDLHPLL
jgi:hypothetical protein